MKYENLTEIYVQLENQIEELQKLDERIEFIDFLEDNTEEEDNDKIYFLKSLYIEENQLFNITLLTGDDLKTEKEIQVNLFINNENDFILTNDDLKDIKKVNEFINIFKELLQNIAYDYFNIFI